MSTVTIPLSPIVDLSEALAAIPVEAKPFLKQGFVALARLPDEKYLDLLTVAAELLVSRHLRPPPLGMASSRFGVPEQEIPALLAAANVVVSVFSARDDTPQQFVQTAIQAGILGEANRGPALALSELALKNRAPLNQVMERVRLGMTVLPSLAHLSTTVDVRPSVSQGRVSFAIPIALA